MLQRRHIFLCLACLVVACLGLEATARLDDWSRHGVPLSSSARSLDDLVVRDSFGMHARPSSQFRGFRINSLGFRGPEVSSQVISKSQVIVASGASETFGLYESPSKEWPRQLEDSLNSACVNVHSVVLNAGFAGMSLPTVIQDIKSRIATVSPDFVIYYPSPTQYLETNPPLPAAPSDSTTTLPLFQLRFTPHLRSAVKRALPERLTDGIRRIMISRARLKMGDSLLFESVPSDRLNKFESDLRELVFAIRSIGATPVLLVHQTRFSDTSAASDQRWLLAWERFYPHASGETILGFENRAGTITRKVAESLNVVLVDPRNFSDITGSKGDLFADFVHFTDRGAAVLAGEVRAKLMSDAALSCSTIAIFNDSAGVTSR